MMATDPFCECYEDLLDGTYDCIDRIVLNAYFIFAQSGGGFRMWWRKLMGDDSNLDNAHLMRFTGRFSRRIRAWAEKNEVPIIFCKAGERKHELAEQYIPEDPGFVGVFCILVSRMSAVVRDVHETANGAIHIENKITYVNHYWFHIIDPDWGHITIKFCPHPPFNAQIFLNGHEYLARQAIKKKIGFTKEGNCFTKVGNPSKLAKVADTMKAESFVGQLNEVCDRWIYSTCLCFALDTAAQEESGFHYSYSVFQIEYSRNLLFMRGRIMEEVFESVIDRTRSPLDIKKIKKIFGYKHRPFHRNSKKPPRFEVVVEKPAYDLTVFKVNFGKLTVKIYSKGERVLRVEVVAHNVKDLRVGKVIDRFPQIVEALAAILNRFLWVLQNVDACFIDVEKLDTWHTPSKVGASRAAGVDINQTRMRAVMEAVIALSINPRGFTSSELAAKVREILNISESEYTARQAAYDLKKLRGKKLVDLPKHSRRYQPTEHGLQTMAAYLVLRNKVLKPLLASCGQNKMQPKPQNSTEIDTHYQNIQNEMQEIFKIIGIKTRKVS